MPDANTGADRGVCDQESSKPSRAKTVLAICRVSNLPTVWMNVLAAAALSGMGVEFSSLGLLLISLSCFYCGGMCLNDVFDRSFDADHQPFRPIPAGQIGVRRSHVPSPPSPGLPPHPASNVGTSSIKTAMEQDRMMSLLLD